MWIKRVPLGELRETADYSTAGKQSGGDQKDPSAARTPLFAAPLLDSEYHGRQ
jgi:hypothetical protein